MKTVPIVYLLRTRIEVGCVRRGRPGYRWTTGYYVKPAGSTKHYLPLRRKEAYEYARKQWPGCRILVEDDKP